MNFSSEARGHLAMFAFSMLIAGSFSIGSRISNLVEPTAIMALRFFISGVIIGIWAGIGPGIRRAHFRAPWRYAVLGALFATYFVLMFEGLKTAPAVSVSAVFTLTPIMSAVAAYFLLRQVLTGRVALALAVGACGAVWVIFRADPVAILRFDIGRGEAIYLVGCVCHAVYVPLVARLVRGEPILVSTFGMSVAGWLLLTAISLPELLRIRVERPASHFLAGTRVPVDCRERLELFLTPVRVPTIAFGESHGLHLFDSNLGYSLGSDADRSLPSCSGPCRYRGHGRCVIHAGPNRMNVPHGPDPG